MVSAEGNRQADVENACFKWICYSCGLVAPVMHGIPRFSTSCVRETQKRGHQQPGLCQYSFCIGFNLRIDMRCYFNLVAQYACSLSICYALATLWINYPGKACSCVSTRC